jgi:predicted ATPase
MIRRLYVHNFRCLENFELPLSGHSSLLLIGMNGAGKTTVGLALEILQRIARGTNRVGDFLKPKDVSRGRTDTPVRFEIEVTLSSNIYQYVVAFELPGGFRELRVLEEKLTADGKLVYSRQIAQVHIPALRQERAANFGIDWHLVALPIVQHQSEKDPLFIFRQWLANTLIIRPIPSLIRGDSDYETLQPDIAVKNLGAWFSGLVASAPAAYSQIDVFLKKVMPDLQDIKNLSTGKESRSLLFQFSGRQGAVTVPFEDLSDGEKCFTICAMVIATNGIFGPLLCFWDDPDNYLAPSEVGMSIMVLRRAFEKSGQLIATSHNPEAIRRFSDENTFFLYRNSHLEPTIARLLEGIRASGELKGDLIDTLVRGDLPV